MRWHTIGSAGDSWCRLGQSCRDQSDIHDRVLGGGVLCLGVEAGIVALMVTLSGLAPVRIFLGFLVGNAAVYFLGFRPLLDQDRLPLAVLECGVLAVDGAIIKCLSGFDAFQGGGFVGLSWFRAITAAAAGNAFSYFIGQVASNPP